MWPRIAMTNGDDWDDGGHSHHRLFLRSSWPADDEKNSQPSETSARICRRRCALAELALAKSVHRFGRYASSAYAAHQAQPAAPARARVTNAALPCKPSSIHGAACTTCCQCTPSMASVLLLLSSLFMVVGRCQRRPTGLGIDSSQHNSAGAKLKSHG
jgi:hypothetical protein